MARTTYTCKSFSFCYLSSLELSIEKLITMKNIFTKFKYSFGLTLFAVYGFGQQISIQDTVKAFEAEGSIKVEVSLSTASSTAVTVRVSTKDATATSPQDYLGFSDTIRFHPGTTRRVVSITIVDDKIEEADEYFFVVLSQPSGATILRDTAICIIKNDDYAPVANDDNFVIFEDIESQLDILLNDFDLDGDIFSTEVSLVDLPKNGTLDIQQSGQSTFLRYTPKLNFFGLDSFTYKLFDGDNFSNIAKVKLEILSVNDAPEWVEPIPNQNVCFGDVFRLDPLPYVVDVDDSIKNNPLFNFTARVLSAGNAAPNELISVYNPVEKTIIFLNSTANRVCNFEIELRAIDAEQSVGTTVFTISYRPQPIPNFTYSTECFGKATKLEAKPVISGGEVLSWGWDFDGDSIFEERRGTTSFVFPSVGFNRLWVFAQSAAGCSVYRLDSVLVLPEFKPKIIRNQENPLRLVAEAAKSYQWYEDGGAVPESEGGKEPVFNARKKAAYYYFAISEQGCTAYSDTVVIDANRLDNVLDASLKAYPVPAANLLQISIENELIGRGSLQLRDLQGRVLLSKQIDKNQLFISQEIDLQNLASGVYSLEIEINSLRAYRKIIVQK